MSAIFLRILSPFACGALLLVSGCVRAPEVAVVTEHTALERQAAGEYRGRSRELEDASLEPGPDPIPREQLAAHGEPMSLGVLEEIVTAVAADERRIDAFLVSRCVGEANTGLLELTTNSCTEDVDPNEVTRLIGRVNVHRRQIWAFLAQSTPRATQDQAREQWRAVHRLRIVCGAQVQTDDGRWETKTCAE